MCACSSCSLCNFCCVLAPCWCRRVDLPWIKRKCRYPDAMKALYSESISRHASVQGKRNLVWIMVFEIRRRHTQEPVAKFAASEDPLCI
ncbi:uncharacterized protein M421DRAFT_252866 [Didymella exigua CBS 183.55]|uniref:Secreted protein n=1 Tax=Didymella exigua CBS 183.55 TaxID=1150837 RepID=A0A6A5S370_9PLEO|nr:uncharacterized protein M421DRAFT_252866 [Didymella exigua CBS 183.55]KAF1932926.1 hypothetical protein M421DRAFT_252866 [Didymella exigua CBS 183.55]